MGVANRFSPLPGRFGVAPVVLTSGRINTGTLAAGTQTHNMGTFPGNTTICASAAVCAEVFPTAATSCTIQLFKMTGATALALTNAVSINAGTANTPIALPIITTLTAPQCTVRPTDSIRVEIVTVGAVSVQPDDVVATIQLLVQE